MVLTREEVRTAILSFLDGTGGPRDWDDFTSAPINDPFLDSVRRFCDSTREGFPPAPDERAYCNVVGMTLMRAIAEAL